MNELTLEWIDKAENDFVVATELLNLRLEATTDAICYHCQQCAEKYAKAYLQQCSIEFPRTHNLSQLLTLCEDHDQTFAKILLAMRALNSYSVEVRYPGRFTSLEEAEAAVEATETIRTFIRLKLGLGAEFQESGDN
jgi:HEPN domain-containing protein